MAGILDYILAQQARKDRERRLDDVGQEVTMALGRRPGVGPFKPGEGGRGLLADPTDAARQAEFVGRLTAADPEIGSRMVSGIFQNIQSGQNTQAQQSGATARQILSNDQSDINSQRAAQTSMSNAQLQADVSRMNSQDRLAASLQAAQAAAGGQAPGIELGPVASGMARVTNPDTGMPIDVALPGSPQHIKARETLNAQEQALTNLDKFLELFDKVGTERYGPDAAILGTYRQRAISAVAQLDNMGVLQAGELDRIESTLMDPTSNWTASTTRNSTLRAGYQALRDQFEYQNDLTKENYKYWPGLELYQAAPIPQGFVPQ